MSVVKFGFKNKEKHSVKKINYPDTFRKHDLFKNNISYEKDSNEKNFN
jgi:hypothetical protein